MTPPPRIHDPRLVPLVGTDEHLPPVGEQRLSVPFVRRRIAAGSTADPEFHGDGRPWFDRPLTHASVLVPLVQRDAGLQVLLTQRSAHLRDHAGQISFPGGRAEDHDADAEATALREAHEEVGLLPARVEILGRLPCYTTVTQYVVTPVVGLVGPDLELALDCSEVDEAFEVPLQFLMNPAHHRRHLFSAQGVQRQFLSMPWTDPASGRERFIWGATAAMLRNLYRLLAE